MSNTDDAFAISGTQSNTTPSRIALPSFTPARDAQDRRESRAESNTSGSKWSAADRQSRSSSAIRAGSLMANSDDGNQEQPVTNTFHRRNPSRNAGGFLLEPTAYQTRLSRASLSLSQKDPKGKRRSEASDILLPKRRNKQIILDQPSSVRSSPLSVEVQLQQDGEHDGLQGNTGTVKRPGDRAFLRSGYNGTSRNPMSVTPSVGLDTDPAQIVDMALKLSEGRRRQASGKRFVSGDTPGKRIISTSSSRQVRTPTKRLNEHVTAPNVVSPPLPNTSAQNGVNNIDDEPMQIDDPFSQSAGRSYTSEVEDGVEISRATAARVEKAKTYLELAYEHRRLLSHLPPVLWLGQSSRPSTPAKGSKAYNPLQYVRNRKLRIREKSTIDAEAEGWLDIEKVRIWVDAVINSHSDTQHDPLECVRLPPLSLREGDEDDDEPLSPKANTSPLSPRQQQNKPRRPKSDWVTHPADLIADACWLEQGLNKTKIQDRNNGPIYPADAPFIFSGWRNRKPADIPKGLQELTPPPEEPRVERAAPLVAAAPELPTFTSARKKEKDESRHRKESKLKSSLGRTPTGLRKRNRAPLDSSSDSDSDSDASLRNLAGEDPTRGRKRNAKDFDLPDGDPFGRPVSAIYPDGRLDGAFQASEVNLSGRDSKRSSIDSSRFANYLKRNSVFKSSSQERGRTKDDSRKHHFFHRSKKSRDDERHSKSSADDDSTAPSSPVNHGLPSIAMNLDAPISRSPSPTKKHKQGRLQPLKDRSRHSDHDKVETNDFATDPDKLGSRETSADHGRTRDSSNHTSRGTSPLTRGTSPFTKLRRESTAQDEPQSNALEHRPSGVSRSSTRLTGFPSQDQQPRIRGMFKGGRIAEIVGNEVSRVNDYIWKRHVPPAYRHKISGSEASLTYDPSDTDEEVTHTSPFKTPFHDVRASTSTQSSFGGRKSVENTTSNDKSQLFNSNLPSFTSPFQRDRERQDQKQDLLSPESDDHISRQAAHHRSHSKSPRMDRLDLPKLDTGAPRSVGLVERRNSYGFGAAMNRSQSASRLFNSAINAESGNTASARSSIAGFSNHLRKSVDDLLAAENTDKVDKGDIFRIESLLLISAVKAKNISATYEQTSSDSKLLLQMTTRKGSGRGLSQPPQVRRRDEHVYVARHLIAGLTDHSTQINDQLHMFSNDTVTHLHQQIQLLEDQIENTVTPRVRVAADNAGALSVKLTTTSTQAVKSLQDMIGEAFRLRRRGPFRWVRLLWYTLIEWFVVGLLWFIWAIVTLIRVFIISFRGIGRTVKWLLWIE